MPRAPRRTLALLCALPLLPALVSAAPAVAAAGPSPTSAPVPGPALGTAPAPQPSAAGDANAVPSRTRLIVKYRASTGTAQRDRVRRDHRLRHRATLPMTGAEVLDVPAGTTATAVASTLRQDPDVAYAVPDVLRKPATNDPGWPYEWGLRNTGQTVPDSSAAPGIAGIDVRASGAWAVTRGSASVTVAVIDQGVDISHPDLAGAIWTNPGEIPGNGIDDDHDGLVDDVHGWDFVHNDATVYDAPDGDWHGTHVAGIIGARGDNGEGVVGLAPKVRIMPLKFMTEDGGYDSDAIRALAYAKTHGARVVNASWGSTGAASADPALRDAISSCGCVFVAAAGNDGLDIGAAGQAVYPASYGLPNELSVAAVDDRGALASFSNYGSSVDLAAPGVSVLSTVPDGQYAWADGTSMATPFVTAAAALALSASPSLTPAQVVDRIRATARPLAALAGRTRTGGMLDAAALLTSKLTTAPTPISTASVSRLGGGDRYATAASIAGQFPAGVPVAYVATGESFPDALAGAALAGSLHAPVVLVTGTSVPSASATALQRLAPGRIVVLGGTGAVSGTVLTALQAYTSGTVTRLAGKDRYETAAAVANEIPPGVPVAYVATGTDFPDALAGAALAGSQGVPVLLTRPSGLPRATADALRRLAPGRIVVLGGTGVVPASLLTALASYTTGTVTRLAGGDRYDTAAQVAGQFAPGVGTVYVATGTGFPDALAGAALAASQGSPVLLTTPSTLAAPAGPAIDRLAPARIVVLGATGAVSDTVARTLGTYSG